MGFVFGATSALCFAIASILFKIGQRDRPDDDGHLVANFVNAVLLGVVALFVARPEWDRAGFLGLVAGGIVGTFLGRFFLLRGIRLVGPTRSNTFQTATPISAAVAGWLLLGEQVAPLEAVGGAISIYGLLRVVRSRGTDPAADGPPVRGYLIAAATPLCFGIAFVLRKWGLERMPGSVTGAFIGSLSGLLVLSLWNASRATLVPLIRGSFMQPAWLYLGAGVVTSGALLAQFQALTRVEAWIVGILGGTVAIWTPFLSMAFLKQDDVIDARLMVNVGIVFAGVVMIAVV